MKKAYFVMAALAAVGLATVACSKGGSLPKEEVAKVLPKAMCAKMIECLPQGGPTMDDCEKALSTQVIEGKNGQPFPTVTKSELDACVAGLGKWTCDQMQTSPNPPTGCEFLAKK
ncbi:MAG: hypothetical protein COV45_04515 [Deltaproteobacteria bacterium CG11_big_fil_rev_8_21_14_0_20_47_16]|nr:MAG: hypothetical protein COV45_04515 [Deltaproteobacteria bacterium CG11_big_fil_rev_8_21_14_0_20_47_16]